VSPGHYVEIFLRRWPVLAVCIVASVIGAVAVTAVSAKQYEASSRVFIDVPVPQDVGQALQGFELSSQLLSSYTKIATSSTALGRISARVGGRLSPDQVRSRLTVSSVTGTLLIDVKARDSHPQVARDLADAGAATLQQMVEQLDPTRQNPVDAKIIDPASLPTTPVRPRPRVNVLLGGLVGLFAGAGLVVALESLDRAVRTPAQAAVAFGAPVLATIPRDRRLQGAPVIPAERSTTPIGEAFRSLRTAIRHLDDDGLRTLLVSSPVAGAGTTTVAANLATAIAAAGERAILIDADLRQPRLSTWFGLADRAGLTSVLLGEATLSDALHWVGPRLSVLPSGPVPQNPAELVRSQRMVEVLVAASELADVVVVDAPPVLTAADAAELGALADGVLLVVRSGATDAAAGPATVSVLAPVGGRIVGLALNDTRGRRPGPYAPRPSAPPEHTPAELAGLVRDAVASALVANPAPPGEARSSRSQPPGAQPAPATRGVTRRGAPSRSAKPVAKPVAKPTATRARRRSAPPPDDPPGRDQG